MDKRKILYISQEISPYVAESHLSTRARRIPQFVQEQGFEVRTFMPKYGCINERRNQLHEVIRLSGMNIIIDDTDHPLIIKVATLQPTRMQVYFIDSDDYFGSGPTKELEIRTSPDDNDERSIFFVRGVVETLRKLRWAPEIIHCTGWITALTPLFLKKVYNDDPSFANAKIVMSLTDGDDFPAPLHERFVEKLLMDELTTDDFKVLQNAPADFNSLMRLAIQHADGVIVSGENVDSSLIDFAQERNIPLLPYQSEDESAAESYIRFYNSL